MNTQAFGGCTWDSMFFMAAGYDLNEEPRSVKDPQYYNYFKSIGDVLPCIYCRRSYKGFFEELKIEGYFGKPCGLMKFVYDLKNKVNEKLLNQEFEAAIERYRALKGEDGSMQKEQLGLELRNLAKIFYTKDAPPFEQVVEDYMKHRAKCSAKMKTCRREDASPLSAPKAATGEGFPITLGQQRLVTDIQMPAATETIYYSQTMKGGAKGKKARSRSRTGKRRSVGKKLKVKSSGKKRRTRTRR